MPTTRRLFTLYFSYEGCGIVYAFQERPSIPKSDSRLTDFDVASHETPHTIRQARFCKPNLFSPTLLLHLPIMLLVSRRYRLILTSTRHFIWNFFKYFYLPTSLCLGGERPCGPGLISLRCQRLGRIDFRGEVAVRFASIHIFALLPLTSALQLDL